MARLHCGFVLMTNYRLLSGKPCVAMYGCTLKMDHEGDHLAELDPVLIPHDTDRSGINKWTDSRACQPSPV